MRIERKRKVVKYGNLSKTERQVVMKQLLPKIIELRRKGWSTRRIAKYMKSTHGVEINSKTIWRLTKDTKVESAPLDLRLLRRDELEKLKEELLPVIQTLREMGYGVRKIKKHLKKYHNIDLPLTTIRRWIRNELKDTKWMRVPIPWIPKRCPELAYLIGVALGDACTRPTNYKNMTFYEFRLKVRSEDFRDEVYKALKAIGLHPYKWTYKHPQHGTWYCTAVSCKKFVLFMNDIKENPKKALPWIYGFESEFIRGFYESEGNLDDYRPADYDLRIVNTRKDYIELICEALRRIGVREVRVYVERDKRPNRRPRYVLKIAIQEEVDKFIKIVRPVIRNEPKRKSPKDCPQALKLY